MLRFRDWAICFASSVLPVPGSPFTSSGRSRVIEAFTAIFKSSVATYASVPENFIFVPSLFFFLSTSLSNQNKPSRPGITWGDNSV